MQRASRSLACAAIGLLTATALACASAPRREGPIVRDDYDYLAKRVAWLVEKQRRRDVAAISLAVVDGDTLVWEGSYGYADAEREIPATAGTVYEVGSVSKLFTAIAVMQLVEAGQVDLDAPFSRYVPEFQIQPPLAVPGAWSADEITPRTMLTHTSGLPGDLFRYVFARAPEPFEPLVARLHEEYAAAPPGLVMAYSNVALTLLGVLVERVSDTPFAEYVAAHILAPTGMRTSSFGEIAVADDRVARGYAGGEPQERVFVEMAPAGALRSTASDLARFVQMLFAGGRGPGGRVLARDTLETMWKRQNEDVTLDFDNAMGLAWFITPLPGVGKTVQHGGATLHFKSLVQLSLEHDVGVVALSNSQEADLAPLVRETLELAIETKPGPPLPALAPETRTLQRLTDEATSALAGHYDTMIGPAALRASGRTLRTGAFPAVVELRPTDYGTFEILIRALGFLLMRPEPLKGIEVGFEKAGDRDVIVATRRGVRALFGSRFEPKALPEAWRERLGSYAPRFADPTLVFERFALELEGEVLLLKLYPSGAPSAMELALEPVDDRRAFVVGIGRNRGDVVRAVSGDAGEVLRYSGYELVRDD